MSLSSNRSLSCCSNQFDYFLLSLVLSLNRHKFQTIFVCDWIKTAPVLNFNVQVFFCAFYFCCSLCQWNMSLWDLSHWTVVTLLEYSLFQVINALLGEIILGQQHEQKRRVYFPGKTVTLGSGGDVEFGSRSLSGGRWERTRKREVMKAKAVEGWDEEEMGRDDLCELVKGGEE